MIQLVLQILLLVVAAGGAEVTGLLDYKFKDGRTKIYKQLRAVLMCMLIPGACVVGIVGLVLAENDKADAEKKVEEARHQQACIAELGRAETRSAVDGFSRSFSGLAPNVLNDERPASYLASADLRTAFANLDLTSTNTFVMPPGDVPRVVEI